MVTLSPGDKDRLLSNGWVCSSIHPDTGEASDSGWWILPASNMVDPVSLTTAVDHNEIWEVWECWGLKRND